jgi:hypothetical protein
MAQTSESRGIQRHGFIKGFHGIRYHAKDLARAAAFYTQHLGFTLEHQALPSFAEGTARGAQ